MSDFLVGLAIWLVMAICMGILFGAMCSNGRGGPR